MLPTEVRRRDLEKQAERAADREMMRIARKKAEEKEEEDRKDREAKADQEAPEISNEVSFALYQCSFKIIADEPEPAFRRLRVHLYHASVSFQRVATCPFSDFAFRSS